MVLSAVIETCMIEEVPLAVIVTEHRVMSAGHICSVKGAELIIAHYLETCAVQV